MSLKENSAVTKIVLHYDRPTQLQIVNDQVPLLNGNQRKITISFATFMLIEEGALSLLMHREGPVKPFLQTFFLSANP